MRAMALCRSLLMEVFYEFNLRIYCMIKNPLTKKCGYYLLKSMKNYEV